MKKAAKKSASRKTAAKPPAKKKGATRSAASKPTGKGARANAKDKKPARKQAKAVKPTKPASTRKAAPTKKAKSAQRRAAPPARKAAPAKKAMTRTTLISDRPGKGTQPQARTRGKAAPDTTNAPQAEQHEAPTQPDVQLPAATYDPTPDTKVPPRGHTSFDHNAQSERAAALKGQRARIGHRRKN
ncbi:MAG: hypothetical protein IPM46_02745 [Flavobacteriales bacterium]|nr:hypothetical protein [Flavobacteriales bacterium]